MNLTKIINKVDKKFNLNLSKLMHEYDYNKLKSSGEDVFISGNVEIRRPHLAEVGNHVAIDSGFYCTTGLEIGNYIHISPCVTVIGGKDSILRMGNFNTIGAGTRIICGSDEFMGEGLMGYGIPEKYKDNINNGVIAMEDFVSIATNSVILQGIKLAKGCIIAAGTTVTKDTEPWMIYMGSPARPIKERPREKMLKYARELGY